MEDELSELKLEFDDLLESGEVAAASLDSDSLQRVTEKLGQWADELEEFPVDDIYLRYVRDRMIRYRDICGFVAETIYSALVYASQENSGGPPSGAYGKRGLEEVCDVAPVLMKTYG